MKRLHFVCLVCLLNCFMFLADAQAEKEYPSYPIELVVLMAPGGGADTAARTYSEELGRVLKVPVNVVNRPGGAGVVALTYVSKAKKDGYTLVQGSSSGFVITPIINKASVTYDPLKDFKPVGMFVSVPSVFAVKSDSPFKTLGELIEYARKNPGKLTNATAGLGAESHFNLEILCAKNNIKITTIPYDSGGQALPDLLGGHVDMVSLSLPTLGPHIKAGKLRGLAVTTLKRAPDFPNIPTATELGHPDVSLCTWYGILAPNGVPQQVLDVLVPTVEKVFKDPVMIQQALRRGFLAEYKDPGEFMKFLESQTRIYEQAAKNANLIKK